MYIHLYHIYVQLLHAFINGIAMNIKILKQSLFRIH